MKDEKEYKLLGVMNGWKQNPPEYDNCKRQGHQQDGSVTETSSNCWHYCTCNKCLIKWEFDSSG